MNIYVGNLSYEVTEADLQKAFEAFGNVETSKVIMETYAGRSKRFGFVEMIFIWEKLSGTGRVR